ncbi:MAG: acetate--CoA ligase [Candidatus Omnitrophica bacterium]|nr:acetate--CoA ligase [Candidatus Omnitrophota bacterium]
MTTGIKPAAREAIHVFLEENRKFPPPASFQSQAWVKDESIYERADKDPEGYWAHWAGELDWFKPWTKVLEWKAPYAQWFLGGKLNASVNCVDRHLKGPRKNKTAILWEGEPGDTRSLTYEELSREVNRFANVLKKLGVRKGDRVTLYLPMIPELAIALLASARIGAVHSVIFGGFSAESLRDRINDAQAKILITANRGWRRGKPVALKEAADEALKAAPSIEKVVVVKRGDHPIEFKPGRDLWWHELMKEVSDQCEPEPMESEDLLFILYTSGTTGKPKGIVHTTGGYLTGVYATTKWVFDLKENDIYWCTADIGWVTGHSYVVYGPLANGATVVMYEGAPDWPEKNRFWKLIEKYKVTIFYTAPTAIRAFMKWGDEFPKRSDLSSLRLLGTVGEPINPEAWMWYHEKIGGGRCPVVDTWWQTETGMIMITPLPGVTTLKPGSATKPFPGVSAEVLNEAGETVSVGGGYAALTKPWPAMLRTIFNDSKRYEEEYWLKWKGKAYFTGDGAKRDDEGYFWFLGRVDDVLNVAGHRIGTMEVESALVDHPAVAEAAVVGKSHEIKGQALAAFVTVKEGTAPTPELAQKLKDHVAKKIGVIARPDDIIFSADLPKTRSGKIMRRLLRDIAEGKTLGDTTTLADPQVVARLKDQYEEKEG